MPIGSLVQITKRVSYRFSGKYRDKIIDVVVVVGSAALDFIARRRGNCAERTCSLCGY